MSRAAFAGRPGAEVPPAGFGDRHVVDTGLATAHQPAVIELPQLVAVAAEPLTVPVVTFVLEADRDSVLPKAPQALAQNIIELAFPLGGEERDDLRAAGDELITVASDGVFGVREADAVRVAGVPGVLGGLDLGDGTLKVERRKRRPLLGHDRVLSVLPVRPIECHHRPRGTPVTVHSRTKPRVWPPHLA
jgi:hypothetical protein